MRRKIFENRKKWLYNRKTSRYFQVWWRVLFFKTWHCKDTPVSRSHWNDEKTKGTCIFNRIKKSDKFTQVEVAQLRRFLMHQWLDVLNKFTQVQIFRHFVLQQSVFGAGFYFGSTPPLPGSTYPTRGVSWTKKWCFMFPIYAKSIKGYVKTAQEQLK